MARSESEGVDGAAVRDVVERALAGMEDVRRVKSSLTGAKTQINRATEIIDVMADRVREHLRQIDELVLAAEGDQAAASPPEPEQSELL